MVNPYNLNNIKIKLLKFCSQLNTLICYNFTHVYIQRQKNHLTPIYTIVNETFVYDVQVKHLNFELKHESAYDVKKCVNVICNFMYCSVM